MEHKLLSEFKNPSALYRGKPFWAWNGMLEEDELRRQIRIFKEMGMGGFFMHSRTGLETEYLSEKWFKLIEACCDEAQKQGLEAWLYDEDRWPSGAAGGIVTKNKDYRQRRLQLDIVEPTDFAWSDNLLCAFVAHVDGCIAYNVKRLNDGELPSMQAADVRVLCFQSVSAEKLKNFNNQTYLDTLNYEAVGAFIESTHKRYQEQFGDLFGNVIPGMFTDEPNHGSVLGEPFPMDPDICSCKKYQVPWTNLFLQTFDERYGYDLLDYLPAIFFDIDGQRIQKVRHDYHDCKTFLFCDAFARQIGQWCKKNKLFFTGHVLWETPLSKQMEFVGSAMRFYEHMDAPGVDILTDCHMLTDSRPEYDTLKQCSSVQNQLGNKWMLSELYGCTGWDFDFKGHKSVGDWQAALGVNLRCHHLSWYTMQGQAKRDFPASIFYQSPWWKLYNKVEEYFARIGVMMTQGSPVRDVLVINPNESMWQLSKIDWQQGNEYKDLDLKFEALRNWLLKEHIDFDYGDEDILSRLACVEWQDGKAGLTVGRVKYKTLVIPPMLTIRSSTLALARQFVQAGGKVIVLDSICDYVDAVKVTHDSKSQQGFKVIPFKEKYLLEAVQEDSQISIRNTKGRQEPSVLYQLRKDDTARYLFICNTDDKQSKEITVSLAWHNGDCFVEDWDAEKAHVYSVEADNTSGWVNFNVNLPPAGSRVFVYSSQPSGNYSKRLTYEKVKATPLEGKWDYSLTEPNVLVLDRPRYRISSGQWLEPLEVLKIDRAIRDHLGISYRGGHMVQPWAELDEHKSCDVAATEMEFEFFINQLPDSKVQLAIEKPGRYEIFLNDAPIPTTQNKGWWVDKSIHLLDIDNKLFRKGSNKLNLSIDYASKDGLEAVFFLGDFGVCVDGTVCTVNKLPEKLEVGDWTTQGLPFYSGSVIYRKNIEVSPRNGEKLFLELPDFAGTCAQVHINNKSVEILPWPVYEVDITDTFDSANVELGIEVVSHRRNSFGPLHLASIDKSSCWNGPEEFITDGDLWQDDYNLVRCGLLAEPYLLCKRRSNSVPEETDMERPTSST